MSYWKPILYPVLKLHAHTHEKVECLDFRPIVESTLLNLCHMSLQILMPFTHYGLLLYVIDLVNTIIIYEQI